MKEKSYFDKLTIDELKDIIKKSKTISDVFLKVGYKSKKPRYFKNLKRIIKENNIDTSHFKKIKHGQELEEIMRINTIPQRKRLKQSLLNSGKLKNQCSNCGQLPVWQDEFLLLQMDHINGDPEDNRLENLRILCPNCHTQTPTYGPKNFKTHPKTARRKCFICKKTLHRYTKYFLCRKHSTEYKERKLTLEETKLLWPIYGMPWLTQPRERTRKSS